MKTFSGVVGIFAALFALGAGVYLLGSESASSDPTVFDSLMHGIGGYCVARGLWMLSQLAIRDRP